MHPRKLQKPEILNEFILILAIFSYKMPLSVSVPMSYNRSKL
jgi:hypothetical protein